jgi:hypothetical protein
MDEDNEGRLPDNSLVEVRYPRDKQEEQGDRSVWPWLPGLIVGQCGPDEWYVCVEDRALAILADGGPLPGRELVWGSSQLPGEAAGLDAAGLDIVPPHMAGRRLMCSGAECCRTAGLELDGASAE